MGPPTTTARAMTVSSMVAPPLMGSMSCCGCCGRFWKILILRLLRELPRIERTPFLEIIQCCARRSLFCFLFRLSFATGNLVGIEEDTDGEALVVVRSNFV
jgi:hypothetical protein